MENTELRLLNWVLHKDTQRYGKVISLQYEAESYKDNETYIEVWDGWKETYYVCRPSHIEPIPLTEEILFKCGFKELFDAPPFTYLELALSVFNEEEINPTISCF